MIPQFIPQQLNSRLNIIPPYVPRANNMKQVYIPQYTNDDELYDTEPNYVNTSTPDNDDKYYNTDPNYNISQEWLLFQRQGDQYDNLDEWDTTPEASYKESFNEIGESTLNEGMVWGPLPQEKIPMRSHDEYQRLLEYYQTEMDEYND